MNRYRKKQSLALPKAQEQPHFEQLSFGGLQKSFDLLRPAAKQAVLRLSPVDQSVFTAYDQATEWPCHNQPSNHSTRHPSHLSPN